MSSISIQRVLETLSENNQIYAPLEEILRGSTPPTDCPDMLTPITLQRMMMTLEQCQDARARLAGRMQVYPAKYGVPATRGYSTVPELDEYGRLKSLPKLVEVEGTTNINVAAIKAAVPWPNNEAPIADKIKKLYSL